VEGDVVKLVEVGGTSGLESGPRLEGVVPHMKVATGLSRDRNGTVLAVEEERVDEGKVVGALVEALGGLVLESSGRDRVDAGVVGLGRVVGPLTTASTAKLTDRDVLDSPDKSDNRVSMTHLVVALLSEKTVEVVAGTNALDLVNEDVTRGIPNLQALVVVDNGSMHKQSRVNKCNRGSKTAGGGTVGDNTNVVTDGRDGSSGTPIEHNKIRPRTEVKVDDNSVLRDGSHAKSDTSILTKVEREDERVVATVTENGRRSGSRCHSGGRERRHVSNHVLVGNVPGLGDTEIGVEIEPVRVHLLDSEAVKVERDLLHKVVHKLASPPDRRRGIKTAGIVEVEAREAAPEPDRHKVIGRALKLVATLSGTEIGVGAGVAHLDGEVREPVGLGDTTNKLGNSMGTTIHKRLQLGEGCEIGVRDRGLSRRCDARHNSFCKVLSFKHKLRYASNPPLIPLLSFTPYLLFIYPYITITNDILIIWKF